MIAEFFANGMDGPSEKAMALDRLTREEIEALLKLLAEFEREEMELLKRERREAERQGRLH